MLKFNLNRTSKLFSVMMGVSLITLPFISIVPLMEWHFVFLLPTLHLKMIRRSIWYVLSIIWFVLFFFMPLFPLPFGCMHCIWCHTFLTYCPRVFFNIKLPLNFLFIAFSSYDHLRTFGCLCYPNLSSTSSHKLAPRFTPWLFLGFFRLIIVDISVSTYHLIKILSPAMS